MPTLDQLLNRAGDSQLEELIGPGTVRLLRMKNPDFRYGATLRKIIKESYGLAGLLENRESRNLLFDILRPEDAQHLCRKLTGSLCSDPYERLKQMNIMKGSRKEEDLYSFFSETPPVQNQQESPPDTETVIPEYPLFPHQNTVVSEAESLLFRHESSRMIIHMPTGAGKTRTAMHLIMRFLNQNPQASVIWLAYSEELCEQAAAEFQGTWKKHGTLDAKIIRFFASYGKPSHIGERSFIVAGLNKTHNALVRNGDLFLQNLLLNNVKLIIMDEAHQAVAPTYKEVLERLSLRNIPIVGLTATPGRSYADSAANMELARFFRNNRIELKIPGYENPVDFLTEEGYLAKTEFLEIDDFISSVNYTGPETGTDFSDRLLQAVGEDDARSLAVLNRLEKLTEKHKRIIYFAPTVNNARVMAHALLSLGIRAFFVSGSTGKNQRKSITEAFRSDDPDPVILCNFGVFTTGFDAPNTSCAVIGRPTKSLVLFSQMAGRAIRGPKAGGAVTAEVYTVTDTTLKGFGAVSDAFSYWNIFYKKERGIL